MKKLVNLTLGGLLALGGIGCEVYNGIESEKVINGHIHLRGFENFNVDELHVFNDSTKISRHYKDFGKGPSKYKDGKVDRFEEYDNLSLKRTRFVDDEASPEELKQIQEEWDYYWNQLKQTN